MRVPLPYDCGQLLIAACQTNYCGGGVVASQCLRLLWQCSGFLPTCVTRKIKDVELCIPAPDVIVPDKPLPPVGNVTQPIRVLVGKYECEIVIRNLDLSSRVKRFGQLGV